MIRISTIVPRNAQSATRSSEDQIGVAIAVDVGGSEYACEWTIDGGDLGSRFVCDVAPRVTDVAQHTKLSSGDQNEIEQSVVVVVNELRSVAVAGNGC